MATLQEEVKIMRKAVTLMFIVLVLAIIAFGFEIVGCLWFLINLAKDEPLHDPTIVIAISAAFFFSSLYFRSWAREKKREAN